MFTETAIKTGHPTLQQSISAAVRAFPLPQQTEQAMGSSGTVRVNHREFSADGRLFVRLIKCTPGESATTVMVAPTPGQETLEEPAPPPAKKAFKQGDFYAVISNNTVVCCTDHFHFKLAENYLQRLIFAHDAKALSAASFELQNRVDANQLNVIAKEGVSKIRLKGVAYRTEATALPDEDPHGLIDHAKGLLGALGKRLVESVSKELTDDAINHLAEALVTIEVHAQGGITANSSLLHGLAKTGAELLNEDESGDELAVEVVTHKGTIVSASQVVLSIPKSFRRLESQDCLNDAEVFPALDMYERSLRKAGVI